MNSCLFVTDKCKEERKVLRCESRRLQANSAVEKEIKNRCRANIPSNVKGLRIELVKQDTISKPCIYKRSYDLVKVNKKWHVEVRNGCRGKFKIRYRKKGSS